MMQCSLLSLGCVFGFAPAPDHAELTALRALKIAQRRLRPEVRTKLLSVASARSGASLVPDAWRFVFLDAGTSGHCRVVTVAAKASSEHPDTVEAFSSIKDDDASSLHPMTPPKLSTDSDQALAEAKKASKLKGISSAQYRLCQHRATAEPVWSIELFAEEDEPVVRLEVGARTGLVKITKPARELQVA
jgi:hypothetical protein